MRTPVLIPPRGPSWGARREKKKISKRFGNLEKGALAAHCKISTIAHREKKKGKSGLENGWRKKPVFSRRRSWSTLRSFRTNDFLGDVGERWGRDFRDEVKTKRACLFLLFAKNGPMCCSPEADHKEKKTVERRPVAYSGRFLPRGGLPGNRAAWNCPGRRGMVVRRHRPTERKHANRRGTRDPADPSRNLP